MNDIEDEDKEDKEDDDKEDDDIYIEDRRWRCTLINNRTKKKNEKLVRVNSSCVRVEEQI